MAEVCADVVCAKLGIEAACRTRETVLLPHDRLLHREGGRVSAETQTTRRVRGVPVQAGRRRAPLRRVRRPGRAERTTVLDALRWIQLRKDPTLALRHSCFHASCGTCGVRVNGREGLGCVTALSDVSGDTVTIEPLANLPVLNDVVSDVDAVHGAVPGARTRTSARASSSARRTPPTTSRPTAASRTASSAACACRRARSRRPTTPTSARPRSPTHSGCSRRRAAPTGRRSWTGPTSEHGAWRCHASFECTEACPSDVRPAQRIMLLRKELGNRKKEVSS